MSNLLISDCILFFCAASFSSKKLNSSEKANFRFLIKSLSMLLPQNIHFWGFSPWISTPCLIQLIFSGLFLYSSRILLTVTTLDNSSFVLFKKNLNFHQNSLNLSSLAYLYFSREFLFLLAQPFVLARLPQFCRLMVEE